MASHSTSAAQHLLQACLCTNACTCTRVACMACYYPVHATSTGERKQIGHHARPWRAPPTASQRTGTDKCKRGSGAGKRAGAKAETVRWRSNHARVEDQAGRQKGANKYAVGGWRVHTADDTPCRNAARTSKHCNLRGGDGTSACRSAPAEFLKIMDSMIALGLLCHKQLYWISNLESVS